MIEQSEMAKKLFREHFLAEGTEWAQRDNIVGGIKMLVAQKGRMKAVFVGLGSSRTVLQVTDAFGDMYAVEGGELLVELELALSVATMSGYQEATARTDIPDHGYKKIDETLDQQFNAEALNALARIDHIGLDADAVKRQQFYSCDPSPRPKPLAYKEMLSKLEKGQRAQMVHALLGMSSELSELIRELSGEGEIDLDKVKLELGDIQWFHALACSAMKVPLGEVSRMNIWKLKARYPEKFCEERARNRDEEAELSAAKMSN